MSSPPAFTSLAAGTQNEQHNLNHDYIKGQSFETKLITNKSGKKLKILYSKSTVKVNTQYSIFFK